MPSAAGNDDMKTIETRKKEVESLLGRQMYKEAVLEALMDPPYGSKNADAKDMNYATVLKALTAPAEKDMSAIVDAAYQQNPELTDAMTKYVYRALAQADACGSMLKWHALIVKKAGSGPLVRAMTDRKTI